MTKLRALISYLDSQVPLFPAERQSLVRSFIAAPKMVPADPEPLSFLRLPEAEFRKHMNAIDADIEAQASIVDDTCRSYFQTGMTPPPHYAWRVAVLLRKRGESALEKEFLRAWNRHFSDGIGGRYADLVERERKLIRE